MSNQPNHRLCPNCKNSYDVMVLSFAYDPAGKICNGCFQQKENKPKNTLDTLVRDLTKAGSIPKSESKRRITKYCQDQDLQLSENIIVWLTNRNKELERKLEECSKKLKQRK